MDKLMFLGFYQVDNKEYYTRGSFMNRDGVDVFRMLNNLPEEERRIYLMTERDWRLSDVKEFEFDYNDDLLSGEQWCVVFYLTREEYRELLFEIEDIKKA